jgi:hypothetical protein
MEHLMKFLISLCLLVISSSVLAGKPTCSSASSGYCSYTGKVSRIYINSGNIILMYFDTPIPTGDTEVASFTITNGGAGLIRVSDNPEFAKLFYSTALAAQASKRNVSVQMRGTIRGYLKIDRIWLAE